MTIRLDFIKHLVCPVNTGLVVVLHQGPVRTLFNSMFFVKLVVMTKLLLISFFFFNHCTSKLRAV